MNKGDNFSGMCIIIKKKLVVTDIHVIPSTATSGPHIVGENLEDCTAGLLSARFMAENEQTNVRQLS